MKLVSSVAHPVVSSNFTRGRTEIWNNTIYNCHVHDIKYQSIGKVGKGHTDNNNQDKIIANNMQVIEMEVSRCKPNISSGGQIMDIFFNLTENITL